MNKLLLLSVFAATLCLAPEANAQFTLPWANLGEFLAAIRSFNLFAVPPLDASNPAFQQYYLISSLFQNRRGCPGGRVFTECYTCDIPCSQRNGPGCDDVPCRRGCGCAPGYYVNARGFCVPEERCELVETAPETGGGNDICPGGRVYTNCARCDLLCSERDNPPACTDRCRPGCSCPNNYYLNAEGDCVTINRCPAPPTRRPIRPGPARPAPRCRGNRQYVQCARCEVSCFQRNNPPLCTLDCRPGCACPEDYYINQRGVCVRRDRCPRPLPPTTRYVPPTTRYVPPTTRYVPPTTRYVPPTTRYVPPTTIYVPPTSRPTDYSGDSRCPQNQVYAECITCIYTCSERFTFTPAQCRAPCRQGCHCDPGYYLNDATRRCVPEQECPGARPVRPTRPVQPTRPVRPTRPRPPTRPPVRPNPRCYGNQIYDSDCVRCEATCENRDFDQRQCTEPCRPGCRCPRGLILNGEDCVRAEECPNYQRPTQRPVVTQPSPGQCTGGQIYDTFCVRCVTTCANRLLDRRGCREPCRVGCRCPDGLLLLRRGDTEECVYVNDCPTDPGFPGTGGPTVDPSNECGECVNGRCTPDQAGRLYCFCNPGYTGINCDEEPLFQNRRCGGVCRLPRRCRFGGAARGFVCA